MTNPDCLRDLNARADLGYGGAVVARTGLLLAESNPTFAATGSLASMIGELNAQADLGNGVAVAGLVRGGSLLGESNSIFAATRPLASMIGELNAQADLGNGVAVAGLVRGGSLLGESNPIFAATGSLASMVGELNAQADLGNGVAVAGLVRSGSLLGESPSTFATTRFLASNMGDWNALAELGYDGAVADLAHGGPLIAASGPAFDPTRSVGWQHRSASCTLHTGETQSARGLIQRHPVKLPPICAQCGEPVDFEFVGIDGGQEEHIQLGVMPTCKCALQKWVNILAEEWHAPQSRSVGSRERRYLRLVSRRGHTNGVHAGRGIIRLVHTTK